MGRSAGSGGTALAWEHSVPDPAGLPSRGQAASINGDKDRTDMARAHAVAVHQSCARHLYVLVTPARNEASLIEKTIESVIHQTVLPLKWVIVDDGSTDNTAEIVSAIFRSTLGWNSFRCRSGATAAFAAKVGAFNAGYGKSQRPAVGDHRQSGW